MSKHLADAAHGEWRSVATIRSGLLVLGGALAVVHACGGDPHPRRAEPGDAAAASSGGAAGTPVTERAGAASPAGRTGAAGSPAGSAAAGTAEDAGRAGASPSGEGGARTGASGAGGDPAPRGCQQDPRLAPSAGACVPSGSEGYACNPVTGDPCAAWTDETCEFDGSEFRCQRGEGLAACRSCDPVVPSCDRGLTCRGTLGRCTRYCCDDTDCSPRATCVLQPPTAVGICQAVTSHALADFLWSSPTAGTAGASGSAGTAGGGGARPDAP